MLSRQIKRPPVQTDDLKFVRIETTRFRGTPIKPADIDKLLAKGDIFADRHLPKERPLKVGDLRNALDIALGQSVIMSYTRNQFVLELTAKARKEGFMGDEIKVFVPATNRTYRVRISGPGKVVWLETLE